MLLLPFHSADELVQQTRCSWVFDYTLCCFYCFCWLHTTITVVVFCVLCCHRPPKPNFAISSNFVYIAFLCSSSGQSFIDSGIGSNREGESHWITSTAVIIRMQPSSCSLLEGWTEQGRRWELLVRHCAYSWMFTNTIDRLLLGL